MDLGRYLSPVDAATLSRKCAGGHSLPPLLIDGFLQPEFARGVAASWPDFDSALGLGRVFRSLNEDRKVQITDVLQLPRPVQTLHELLASDEFRTILTNITGIRDLLTDPTLSGGGIHLMASGARLDVHVDFNLLTERQLFRRLNILIFLNERWEEGWGGELELWDRDVRHLAACFTPSFNRCVAFATSEISFHGVRPVKCPNEYARKSFAAYYYAQDAPEGWDGRQHTTVFKARPNEWFRGAIMMPAFRVSSAARRHWRRVARRLQTR